MTSKVDRAMDSESEASLDRRAPAPAAEEETPREEGGVRFGASEEQEYEAEQPPKPVDLMTTTDIDASGREKIRVNIGGGARRTVNTESMNTEQFDRFKGAVNARKGENGDGGNDIDIQHLSEMLHSSEAKHDHIEEQKMIHAEMRQQILRLTSIMGFQTVVIFALVIIVAWLFKDQFVEDGALVDGDGNVLKVGSSDFSLSGGMMSSSDGKPVTTQNMRQKVSVTETPSRAMRRMMRTSEVTGSMRRDVRRALQRIERRRLAMVEEDNAKHATASLEVRALAAAKRKL